MVIGVASKSRITRSGAAPACHARCTSERACLTNQVELRLSDREQHPPRRGNRGEVPEQRRLAGQRLRGLRHSARRRPAITARSQRTRPGSWPERRSRVPARAALSPSVSPSRCATSASSAVPAREDKPVPSALTSTVSIVERPITFKVTS